MSDDDTTRTLNPADHVLIGLQHALATCFGPAPAAQNPYPAEGSTDAPLDGAARRHSAGLMRVNHAGEVCAQALYLGQAAVSRDPALREQLEAAAQEEADHLAWCDDRLRELDSAPSRLNPLWYAGSYAMGALAGLFGDRVGLGFIVETERQVEAHLGEHLVDLPAGDERSRAIVRQMQADEARHGADANDAGAGPLPEPVPRLMALTAQIMKWAAYRA